MQISNSVDLFTVIYGLYYQGNSPSIFFSVPDLRGRVPVGTLESAATGHITGTPTLGIGSDQLPAHTHSVATNPSIDSTIEFSVAPKVSPQAGSSNTPQDNISAVTSSENRYTDAANAMSQMGDSTIYLSGGFSLTSDLVAAPTGNNGLLSSYSPYLGINMYVQSEGVFPSKTNAPANDPNNDLICGEIRLFAGDYAPAGWEFCRGQVLIIETYPELFSLLLTKFGGDGRTTFGLPDLGLRMPQGLDGESQLYLGELGGTYTTSLTLDNLPPHSHMVSGSISVSDSLIAEIQSGCAVVEGTENSPDNNYFAISSPGNAFQGDQHQARQGGTTTVPYASDHLNFEGALSVSSAGPGNNFDVVMPMLQMSYIICLNGLFPRHD